MLDDMSRARLPIAAALIGGYGAIAARAGRPGRREQAVFERLNGGVRPWLRLPQQWGTPWTLPAVAALAAARRRPRHTVVVLAALPLEKGAEVLTKKLWPRHRPIYVQPTALRDDAPVEGGSMPSGHAAIAACATVLLTPLVPAPVTVTAAVAALLSGTARIQQGAHEPADVVAGLLLGTGIGLVGLEVSDRLA